MITVIIRELQGRNCDVETINCVSVCPLPSLDVTTLNQPFSCSKLHVCENGQCCYRMWVFGVVKVTELDDFYLSHKEDNCVL